ncbi:hypothetical protein LJB42_002656 [Komagataella kurtzmanii]|nr:hypothetical protein LJB42_002656 [Komagataella kurtzmanii]
MFKRTFSKAKISETVMSINKPISSNLDPPINRNMRVLDRLFFSKTFPVVGVYFPDPKKIGLFLSKCRQDALRVPNVAFIVKFNEAKDSQEEKLVLLNESIQSLSQINSSLAPSTLEFIEANKGVLKEHLLTLDYDFWKSEEILKAILPDNLEDEIPSGFTRTGHIAHVNLKEEYKPYSEIIGQVIMDKNPSITTVVDKVDSIETTFRTFKMKVIAGEPNFMVEQRESDCLFTFDFSKVYWNSRLHTEHKRLVDLFKPHTAICDVMAGVGPFAVPSGKKECFVFANDLNPESFKYLDINVSKNKVNKFVKVFNTDGRDFITQAQNDLFNYSNTHKVLTLNSRKKQRVSKDTTPQIKVPIPNFFSHYIMNLPDSAIEFVDAYVGLFTKAFPQLSRDEVKSLPNYLLPTINVHHFEKFSPNEEPTEEELHRRIHEKIKKLLSFNISFEKLHFHMVRKVSPTKPMFCISFQLPEEVAFSKSN